jgi:hypothetical protein
VLKRSGLGVLRPLDRRSDNNFERRLCGAEARQVIDRFWPNPAIGERQTLNTDHERNADHDLPELVINVTGIRSRSRNILFYRYNI